MKIPRTLLPLLVSGLFTCLFSYRSFAQTIHRSIAWQADFEQKISEEKIFKTLSFTGAFYTEDFLPLYTESFPINGSASEANAELSNIITEPVPDINSIPNSSRVADHFVVTTNVVFRKKVPIASVNIIPVRKVQNGKGFERLVSFDLTVTNTPGIARRNMVRNYAGHSVLASGAWYRVAILSNGLYKMDYTFLKNLGIDVDHLDPRNIRVYGNGGGMLPFANAKTRFDDLQENHIIVSGESDGVFDPADYVLFYGSAQTRWDYDEVNKQFNHVQNYYADSTYYFITTDLGHGSRMQQQASNTSTPTSIVTSYDDYGFHEAELVNLLKSGREWYGESLDNLGTIKSFVFTFPGISTTDSATLRISTIGHSTNSTAHNDSRFTYFINNSNIGFTRYIDVGTSPQDNFAIPVAFSKSFVPSGATFNVGVQMTSSDPNAIGYVNALEMNVRRNLDQSTNNTQFEFRDSRSVSAGGINEFRIGSVTNGHQVFDITDAIHPKIQEIISNPGYLSFRVSSDVMHEFLSIANQNYLTPIKAGTIENQDLHSLSEAEMLIVTNPLFLSQANTLAKYRTDHDHLRVHVATTQQIFNEFSSGAQDVSAIRDFMKMFYDRASSSTDLPKYLLLLGDASYDNKYRISANTNYVTSYQSAGSLNQTQTYMSDDYFGLLDDNEGDWSNSEIVDMAVGRLPVKSVGEADGVVKKLIHYGLGDLSHPSADNPGVLADWRNSVTFVGDDQDANQHFKQSDTLANRVINNYPVYNVDKIYLDAYNQVSTPGGNRYPDAHNAIVDKIQRGTLLMTYIGHGGEVGWAHERILENGDIENWTNFNACAGFLTATCEFTRVDDPDRTSAGELVFLNPNGGGICLWTTSRLAFSNSNYTLCQRFFTHVFAKVNGNMPTIGEVFEQTKIETYSDQYVRNFLLLGDPAMRLAYPKFNIKTNTIDGITAGSVMDTLKALKKVTITGEVQDADGQKLTSFNGLLFPTIFDKKVTYFTLGNDQGTSDPSYPAPFELQKNAIYRGKVSVVNGDFSFNFVVPKDILYQYGLGKLSYYAENGVEDANGYFKQVTIGGSDSSAHSDYAGPKIELYINDDKFVRGSMTDKNPILYAIVTDSSGINTAGTGIGHDMTAQLDKNSSKIYVLNDYYQNDLNSYQRGQVHYPFKNLASGPHTVQFKVWDVFNNSSEASTEFIVTESAKLALDHVLNYPNPFTTHTQFMFEHNKPFITMDVQVQIFTVSGKLIKTLSDKIISEGYRSDDAEGLKWDGLDDYGDKIGKGVYIYKLKVSSQGGDYADKFEKLVILR